MVRKWMALALAPIAIALAPAGANSQDGEQDRAARDIAEVFRQAVVNFREQLRDPRSARFRRAYFRSSVGANGVVHYTLCGEFNAQNGMGGYAGWRTFYASDDGTLSADGDALIAMVCEPSKPGWMRESDFAPYLERDVTAP